MKSSGKVLAIALDAAEPELIEQWMLDGSLRNLAALRSKGSYGRLHSSAEWLAGSPWPTFYTGTLPGKHGFYHYLQWNSSKMEYERPGPEWIDAVPFWRRPENDYRVIAVDIPLTFMPVPFNGIEISGWASHDRIYPPSSYPEEKMDWVVKNFGKPPLETEIGGPLEINDILKIKDEVIFATKKAAELILSLMKNEEWDLCLCCFGAAHRAGHKFWDITNVKGNYSAEQIHQFKSSLKEVYISCDEAAGKIINESGSNTSVLVFSLHGMGTNTTLADKMLSRMISNVLNKQKESEKEGDKNFIKKIRNLVPLEIRADLRKFLPHWLQDKLTAYWRMSGIDWTQTRAFNMITDLQGYIRINLKGREKNGIVENETEYTNVCTQLAEGLKSFRDLESNDPVIEDVKRKDELFTAGKGFDNLPDLLVKWKYKPAAGYTRIGSPEFGEIVYPSPGLNPDGRSGNHRPEGFLLASGKKIKDNFSFEKKHIIDLAPTILKLLEVPLSPDFDGKEISEIFR